jgi:hypothetical protein
MYRQYSQWSFTFAMSGSSMDSPPMLSLIKACSSLWSLCETSINSSISRCHPRQPTTHRVTDKQNSLTRKWSNTSASSQMNDRTTGTNSCHSQSSHITTSTLPPSTLPLSLIQVETLAWASNRMSNLRGMTCPSQKLSHRFLGPYEVE